PDGPEGHLNTIPHALDHNFSKFGVHRTAIRVRLPNQRIRRKIPELLRILRGRKRSWNHSLDLLHHRIRHFRRSGGGSSRLPPYLADFSAPIHHRSCARRSSACDDLHHPDVRNRCFDGKILKPAVPIFCYLRLVSPRVRRNGTLNHYGSECSECQQVRCYARSVRAGSFKGKYSTLPSSIHAIVCRSLCALLASDFAADSMRDVLEGTSLNFLSIAGLLAFVTIFVG